MKKETIIGILFTFLVSMTFASGGASIMEPAGDILSEKTLIPLGIFIAGIGVVSTIAWKLATVATRVLVRMENLERRISRIEDELK